MAADHLGLETDALSARLWRLSQVVAMARKIQSSLDLDNILGGFLESSMAEVGAFTGAVYLLDPVTREWESKERRPKSHFSSSMLEWGRQGLARTLDRREIIEMSIPTPIEGGVRCQAVVPLIDGKGEILGALQLFKKDAPGFSETERFFLRELAGFAALAIGNARLHEQEKELQRVQDQMQQAALVQSQLLPQSPPMITGYDIAGVSKAALELGGDYFDFLRKKDGRWIVCLGDVSGKGLPASLVMANMQATTHLLAMQDTNPDRAMSMANTLLLSCTPIDKFMTFFLALLDPVQHTLRYSSAGHNPPLLLRSDETKFLESGGMPLGAVDVSTYTLGEEHLGVDDVLVLFSDGITEPIDAEGDEFGEERLEAVIVANRGRSAQAIQAAVFDAVLAHSGHASQFDDMTLVIIKRVE